MLRVATVLLCLLACGLVVALVAQFRGCWAPLPTIDIPALTTRSAPLVAAIERHTKEHGTPPARLDELVPAYIDVIPTTGSPKYPSFGYLTFYDPDLKTMAWQLEAKFDAEPRYKYVMVFCNSRSNVWREPD